MDVILALALLPISIAIIALAHLFIPWIVAADGKPRKTSNMWLFAIIGGVVGFILCALLVGQFRGFAGLLQSTFWTVIGFFIIRKKCKDDEEEEE
jgi:hypothetical protein